MPGRRVLVVSPLDIFPPTTGGMSRTHNIIKALLPRYDVALACPKLQQAGAVDLPVRVHELLSPGKAQFVNPLFVQKIRSIISREHPDAILASFIWTVPAVWLARLPSKVAIYVDTQNVETERLRGAGARWWRIGAQVERLAMLLSDRVFVVSNEDRLSLQKLGMSAKKGVLVPNGYDEDAFFPDAEAGSEFRASLGISQNESMFLYFGHMGYAPNQEALAELRKNVLPLFDQRGLEYRLVVAGRNSRELAKIYHHPRMTFVGVVDRIQAAINAANVVVVPLLRGGGTRTKIIESAACGTPVVSTTPGAAGLERETLGNLLTIADGWQDFACATMRASRFEKPIVTPLALRQAYGWNTIGRRIELDGN